MAGPYQREVYDNSRSTGRLVDLIARRGDTQARLALERGDIAARTANDIGGIVSGTLSSLAKQSVAERERKDAEARQQREDARRAVIEGRQDQAWQQQQETTAKQGMESAAVSGALRQNDKGVWSYDMDVLAEGLKRSGLGDRLPAIQARLQEAEASTVKFTLAKQQLAEHQAKTLGNLAAGVAEAGNSPEAFTLASTLAVKNGLLSEDALAPYLEQIQKDPKSVGTITTQLIRQAGIKAEKDDKPTVYKEGDVIVGADGKMTKIPKTPTPRAAGDGEGSVTPAQRAIAKRTFDNAVTDAEAVFASAKRAAMREGITPEAAAPMIAEAEAMRDRAIRRARATFYETTQEEPPAFDSAEGSAKVGVKAGGDARVDVRSGRSASNNAANNDRPSLPASVAATAPMSEPRMGRSQAAPSGGAVMMKLPDGRVVPIFADKVEEAKRRGAVEVR